MKNLIILLSIATAALALTTIFAQGSVQLKEMSLKACEAQASQVPEAQRESMIHICKRTVENTDYEPLISKSAAGGVSRHKMMRLQLLKSVPRRIANKRLFLA